MSQSNLSIKITKWGKYAWPIEGRMHVHWYKFLSSINKINYAVFTVVITRPYTSKILYMSWPRRHPVWRDRCRELYSVFFSVQVEILDKHFRWFLNRGFDQTLWDSSWSSASGRGSYAGRTQIITGTTGVSWYIRILRVESWDFYGNHCYWCIRILRVESWDFYGNHCYWCATTMILERSMLSWDNLR